MPEIRGVITALATPFGEGGGVDEDAARGLASHLLEHGSHGLVIAGSTGEGPTLTDDEKISLLRAVRAEAGDDVLVVCGTGSNDTAHSVELTRRAADSGADAALVVTPYYNKPNEAGLRAHFEAVAGAAPELPNILYNIPSRCVINVSRDLLADLAATVPNIVGVKQANNEDIGPIEGMTVLAGNDDVYLRALELGCDGGILVASHIVGDGMREIWDSIEAGDVDRAREVDASIRPAYDAMADTNPIPLKAALAMLGLCEDRLRLPMVPADDAQRASVRAALDAAGVTVEAAG